MGIPIVLRWYLYSVMATRAASIRSIILEPNCIGSYFCCCDKPPYIVPGIIVGLPDVGYLMYCIFTSLLECINTTLFHLATGVFYDFKRGHNWPDLNTDCVIWKTMYGTFIGGILHCMTCIKNNLIKLEQLERLRSGDTPTAPWLPTLLTSLFWIPSPYYWPVHIGSQVKTRWKPCENL